MTAEVINAKQGLTRIPTYAELIKEIDREKFKTNDIRKIVDRNAWYFHESPQGQPLNTNNIHKPTDVWTAHNTKNKNFSLTTLC